MTTHLPGARKRGWLRLDLLVVALAGLLVFNLGWPVRAHAACTGGSFPCDWGFKRKLTFNNSGQPENLVNFPVLVVLNSSRIDYNQTQDQGQDLRFTDSDGTTLLAHEIEKWDELGTSYVWVKVPQIDGSSTTDHIWMFYGNPAAPDGQNPTAVWSNGFTGVWHLKEDPSGTAPQMKDSTSNARHGTSGGAMTASDQVTGKIAGSLDLDGIDDYVSGLVNPTGQFTVSVWFYSRGTQNTQDPSGIQSAGSFLSSEETGGTHAYDWRFYLPDTNKVTARWDTTTANNVSIATASSISHNQWVHAVAVQEASTFRIYLNGVENVSSAMSAHLSGTIAGVMGRTYVGTSASYNQYFDGLLDELRVSNVARSADWIMAQYLSMTDVFISFSSPETIACSPQAFTPCSWQRRRKLTFNNSGQPENLVNFPVLVVLNSSRIDYSKTQSAGQDLRFTDADGTTLLAHEIESWTSGGTSYVWVKVPQIDASSTTDHIWMYYGNNTIADGQNKTGVWDNGYAGVWHLKEASNSTRADSTCNNNNLTDVNTVAAGTGRIAGAANFIAANTEYLTISDAAQTGLDVSTQFTVEAWAKPATTDATRSFLAKHDAVPQHAYNLRLSTDRFTLTTSVDGTNDTNVNGASTVSAGTWYYVVGTYDGSQMRLYRDGSLENSGAASGTIYNSTSSFNIGARDNGTQPFNGDVDEGRVSNVARSAAWIAAQYKSMTDTFITYGTEEAQGSSVTYFSPDAAAPGMHIPVTFVGSFCAGSSVTTSSSDIIVGPSIVTDSTGAVVASNGSALTTMFFVKPGARPQTGITVTVDGQALGQTFDVVVPAPDPNITSGAGTLSLRTKRGTRVLGGLTVGAGASLTIDKSDTDAATAGAQGYLPAVILVKGEITIAGTLDIKGQDGANASANGVGGAGGAGGPGGGGGGAGGLKAGTAPPTPASIDRRVATGNDDAEQNMNTNSVNLTSSDLEMILDGSVPQQVGIRFANMTIPQGATITNAYVAFVADPSQTVTTNLTVYGQANDNAPTFTTSSNNIASRTKTSASVAWNNLPTWTTGTTYQTPNISSVIQEIVNRPGWASGNAIVIIVTGSGSRNAKSYNGSSSQAPLLHVDYTSGGGASASLAPAGAPGLSGGGGGGSNGTGTGGAGGDGTSAVGSPASGTTGGNGGTAMGGGTGGGGGKVRLTGTHSGNGGGGGTGNPFGAGGQGGIGDNTGGPGGQGGGGGGAAGSGPGGGGGGGFGTAGANGGGTEKGFGGAIHGNAQLMPLGGGSGGGGGGPDMDLIPSVAGGGGGGGGAILLYATGPVNITGTITAQGGKGGNGFISGGDATGAAGGGSGGAIMIQSGKVTAGGTLTTAGGAGGTSDSSSRAGGAGGSGRIRIDGLSAGATVPGTSGSKYIGPVIDALVDKTVKGRANGGSTVTLYVYDENGVQVSGSPYTTTASGSSGTVGTWSISNVIFPSGHAYLAVKQSSGSVAVFGPGRASKGLHLTNWREIY